MYNSELRGRQVIAALTEAYNGKLLEQKAHENDLATTRDEGSTSFRLMSGGKSYTVFCWNSRPLLQLVYLKTWRVRGTNVKGVLLNQFRQAYWIVPSWLLKRNCSFSSVSTDVRGLSAVILKNTYIYRP
jgi:hypothetical protein